MERFWAFLDKPLTQTGFAMVLAIVGTIVPSKIAMIIAGFVFLFAGYREGWFKGQKWYVALGRIVASSLIIAMVLGSVWLLAWRLRERSNSVPEAQSHPPPNIPSNPPEETPAKPHKKSPSKPSPGQRQSSGHDNPQTGPITQGPCSNVQVGGINNQAITNCGPPEPTISWSTKDELRDDKKITWVSIKVDYPLNLPAFVATCDRPCKSLGAAVEGHSHDTDLKVNRPNMTGTVLLAPRPLGPGLQVQGQYNRWMAEM
jgi:hypothetical protein